MAEQKHLMLATAWMFRDDKWRSVTAKIATALKQHGLRNDHNPRMPPTECDKIGLVLRQSVAAEISSNTTTWVSESRCNDAYSDGIDFAWCFAYSPEVISKNPLRLDPWGHPSVSTMGRGMSMTNDERDTLEKTKTLLQHYTRLGDHGKLVVTERECTVVVTLRELEELLKRADLC